MGYKEAVEDNVKMRSTKSVTSVTVYYPKCCICGEEVMTYNYKRGTNYTCNKCKIKNHMADKEKMKLINKEEKDKKLENAIKRIGKQAGTKINEYSKAIEIIKKKLYNDRWFDSTEEIMVALELIRKNVKARHQVKMGIYRLDFVLPDEKIVLEVDGTVFHTERTKEKEDARDNIIILNFGSDWEVVRITDELINQNVRKLVPAIRAVRDKRQKIRKQNDGQLPDWYSNRN